MSDPLTPHTVAVRALGAVVRVVVPERCLRERVERAWRQCLVDPAGPPAGPLGETVTAGTPPDGSDEALARTMQTLTQAVTAAAIRARAGSLLMFHAGALCDQVTGAAVAFVAPGGTGKTTAVRTLGPGRGYVTDETVGVAPDGSMQLYPKPLSVRRPDLPTVKDEIPPHDLGLELPRVDPWLAGIVVLRRDLEPGAPVQLEPIGTLDALVALAPETSSLARLERPLHTLATTVERAGGLRAVRYHDAADLEPVVVDLLGSASR